VNGDSSAFIPRTLWRESINFRLDIEDVVYLTRILNLELVGATRPDAPTIALRVLDRQVSGSTMIRLVGSLSEKEP